MDPQDFAQLELRVRYLEDKTAGIQPTWLLNDISVDVASGNWLQQFIALPYDTVIPTWTATNGTQKVIKTGGLYYLYIWVDGAWRRVQIT